MRLRLWIVLCGLAALGPATASAAGDRAVGQEIAQLWCAQCHLVSPDQEQASADVPTFMAIAERSQGDLAWLEAFLADPHPPMPDFSLTRQEIRDLIAYFDSLRQSD